MVSYHVLTPEAAAILFHGRRSRRLSAPGRRQVGVLGQRISKESTAETAQTGGFQATLKNTYVFLLIAGENVRNTYVFSVFSPNFLETHTCFLATPYSTPKKNTKKHKKNTLGF